MKTIFTFLVFIFFFTTAHAQEIEATLSGNTSNEGFSVKNNAGANLFRITGEGNVGIGTTAPVEKLQIGGFSNGDIYLGIKSVGGNTARNGIKFRNFNENYGWTIQNDERLVSDGLNFLSHFDDPDGVSRLFLSKFGNVGIGTASPQSRLDVVDKIDGGGTEGFVATISNTRKFSGNGLHVKINNSSENSNIFMASTYWSNGTLNPQFNIWGTGQVVGSFGIYHAPSDIRLKKEIITIPGALDKVLKLRGVNYKWKKSEKDQTLHMGLIAQEVEKVVTEVVHTASDSMQTKAVEYQYLVGLLVEAVKEQQKQIKALEKRVSSIALKEHEKASFGYKTKTEKLENFNSISR